MVGRYPHSRLALTIVATATLWWTAGQPVGAQEKVPLQAAAAEFEGTYQPADALERGLWLEMAEYERSLKISQQVISDPTLNVYLRDVLCRTVGPECNQVRLYILRSPEFNATMAPNGVMTVWSGLLLRVQNEAQLAAVLGHEFAHFKRRHSLQQFRRTKSSTNAASWLSFAPIIGSLASFALLESIFDFSREQEEEADIDSLRLMAAARYDTAQAPLIWEQLLDERDATLEARGRKKEKRKTNAGMFNTHPTSQARIEYLRAAMAAAGRLDGATDEKRYRATMAAWWPQFLDDQLKTNDQGGSLFLIDNIEKAGGWSPWIAYARAEFHRRRSSAGDIEVAIGHYSDAIARGGDLPELWRGRGFALRKAGRTDDALADLREYLGRKPDASDRAMVSALVGLP